MTRLGVALLFAAGVFLAGGSSAGAALPRAATDRPDDRAGPQVHFLYVVPRDGDDRALDTSGVVSAAVSSWQSWLRRQTGGRALYVDTYQGQLDVSFFRLATDDATVAARGAFVREQIEEEIFAAGFNSPSKLYAVYYDGSSTWSCGGADPDRTFRGNVVAMYLKGTPPGAAPCSSNTLATDPPGYFEFGMLHEIVHSLGFVATCAPHVTRVDHVSDSPFDLMWAGDAPWRTDAPDQMQLDVGHDDYYGHGRPGCPDLATNPYLGPPERAQLVVGIAGRGAGKVQIRASGDAGTSACPPACENSLPAGADVSLTALAAGGSAFAGWEGSCSGTQDTCSLRLDNGTIANARFERKRYKVVVAVRGPGRVGFRSTLCSRRCATLLEHGTPLVLRAQPRRNATFVGWRGACKGTRTCRFIAVGPSTITARFQARSSR